MSAESNLAKLLDHNFNEDEMRFLCADLDISYESLPGNNKKRKALEIVDFMQRRGQYDLLVKKVAEERPHLQPQLNAIESDPPSGNANQTNPVTVNTNSSEVNGNVTTVSFYNPLIVFIAVAVGVSLLIILGVWGTSWLSSLNEATTDTAVPTNRFTYQVRVQENSNNQPVENANITIYLPGIPPINDYTDSTGLAVFRIDNQFANELVTLHITKDGFEDWDQNITIKADEQPLEIKLEKVP